jgi:CheY-like chemotaxis protein
MSISILLADDSITIQKVIGIIFGGDDYAVTVVDNGKAAVEKAIEIKPDVLLIDALMPGMSGYEVCEQIREIPELRLKPIVLLTGSFEPFDEDKAKTCGADTFLSKPFESQQIVSKVAEMHELGLSRASAAHIVEPVTTVTPPPLPVQEVAASEPTDIWGAFTPEVSAKEETKEDEAFEQDQFEKIDQEAEAGIEVAIETEKSAEVEIGSQWVPVEEHTFEFEEETLSETPAQPSDDNDALSFGEVSFDETVVIESHEQAIEFEAPVDESPSAFTEQNMPEILESIPAFEESEKPEFVRSAAMSVIHPGPAIETSTPVFEPAAAAVPVAALSTPTDAAAPAALSEEQLKAALASVSKEVIERIVWEVVPDLAEAMIKEAIRKIKEGQ